LHREGAVDAHLGGGVAASTPHSSNEARGWEGPLSLSFLSLYSHHTHKCHKTASTIEERHCSFLAHKCHASFLPLCCCAVCIPPLYQSRASKDTGVQSTHAGSILILMCNYATQEKNILHKGSVTFNDIIEVARVMRPRSCAKSLAGTCKEILGTAVSVGCKVDQKHPSAIMEMVSAGHVCM